MDLLRNAPDDRLAWAFMAGFERWAIHHAQQLRQQGTEGRRRALKMDAFLSKRGLIPGFDAHVLAQQKSQHNFLPHRKALIDACLVSILDDDAKHGTIKVLLERPRSATGEDDKASRARQLGGGYTRKHLQNLLRREYAGIARPPPDDEAKRESAYRTAFTPDDFAPEQWARVRENASRGMASEPATPHDWATAMADLRYARPDVVADMTEFRAQVAESLRQLGDTKTFHSETIQALRESLLPYSVLLAAFYHNLMAALAGIWYEKLVDNERQDLLDRGFPFNYTLSDAEIAVSQLLDLTGNDETTYLYGQFAAMGLLNYDTATHASHLWTALAEQPRLGEPWRAMAYHNQGDTLLKSGAYEDAILSLGRSATLYRGLQMNYRLAVALKGQAEACHRAGDWEQAARLFAESL